MSLIISGDLRLRNQLPVDADADAYIAAVEAADGQALEPGVKFAIKNFVLCCKQDGIWTSIKASCILAGARTLSGALVPLVGTAPTNFNFVSGDYNRKTGLMGNASTKYLNSNRNNNADPQNSKHMSIFVNQGCTVASGFPFYLGVQQENNPFDGSYIGRVGGASTTYANINSSSAIARNNQQGFHGSSRSVSTSFSYMSQGGTSTSSFASIAALNENLVVFARRSSNGATTAYTNARLAFYSIGESLDLALLDARVTTLINAFAAAIP